MRTRWIKSSIVAAVLVIFTAFAAIAVELTAGTGKTAEGNTIGFNAKADLTGQLTYIVQDPGGGIALHVQCDDYKTYRLAFTAKGFPRTRVTAQCTDMTDAQNPITVWIKVYFIDKGEPGNRDRILFYLTYDPAFKRNAENDPNALVDAGTITAGNVQILTDESPTVTQMMVPVSAA